MADEAAHVAPGAVALVGSGEYTDAMNETDSYLLKTIGGAHAARVVVLPTASGLEPGSPQRWNSMGVAHFQALRVADVRASMIVDRASAADEAQLALLRDADLYYFSGGNPQYVVETLRDTPAWEIIAQAHASGAVLAGCSAGAMMLGGRTMSLRVAMTGLIEWKEALGVVPRCIVFPHFDRMPGFLTAPVVRRLLGGIPAGCVGLGIDEDTALVRVAPPDAAGSARWRVMGRQAVTLFEGTAPSKVLRAGAEITL
jgi:cyanophycinase